MKLRYGIWCIGRICLMLCSGLLLSRNLNADPGISVNSAISTGTSHMAQFTISGYNLGVAPHNGIPVLWWDGRSNMPFPSSLGQTTFNNINGVDISIVNLIPNTGTPYIDHAIRKSWSRCSTSGDNSFYSFQLNIGMPSGSTAYTYAWRYHNYSLNSNIKMWRYNDGPQIYDFLHSIDGAGGHVRSYNQKTYPPNPNFTYDGDIPAPDMWHVVQYEWAYAGYWRYIDNGQLQVFSDWYSNGSPVQNEVELEYQHVDACPGTSAVNYFTQVYQGESFFEVFGFGASAGGICSFNSTTTLIAPQIPATWNQTQITGRLNLDNLNTSNGFCLVVRDGNRRYSNPVLLNGTASGPLPVPTPTPTPTPVPCSTCTTPTPVPCSTCTTPVPAPTPIKRHRRRY